MNAVCPASDTRRSTSSCKVPRVSASSAENGSSISSSWGAMASARAMPTRCFMPPDSSAGLRCAASARPTSASTSAAWASTCARLQPRWRERTAKATLPRAVSQGSRAWDWKMTARSSAGPVIGWPAISTAPPSGASSPARMLRMVVLPQPEWPISETNSPRSTPNHTSWNTGRPP